MNPHRVRIRVVPVLLALLMAIAARAQDDAGLPGTWERGDAEGTTRLILEADGGAAMAAHGTVPLRDPENPDTRHLPETITVDMAAQGTWRVEADRLFLDLPERRLRIDGEAFDDALQTLATRVAEGLAEEQGLGQESVPTLAALALFGLQSEYDEESLLDDLLGDLTTGRPYRVDGDRLTLTDAEGVDAVWRRVVDSAVAPASWAAVKRRR